MLYNEFIDTKDIELHIGGLTLLANSHLNNSTVRDTQICLNTKDMNYSPDLHGKTNGNITDLK